MFVPLKYSETVLAYSEPCITLPYSEPLYVQNAGIFRTLTYANPQTYSEPEPYSETFQRSAIESLAIVNGCNYFRRR